MRFTRPRLETSSVIHAVLTYGKGKTGGVATEVSPLCEMDRSGGRIISKSLALLVADITSAV